MVERFGDRTIIMIGSVGAGLFTAAASLATSFELVLICYGLFTGKCVWFMVCLVLNCF